MIPIPAVSLTGTSITPTIDLPRLAGGALSLVVRDRNRPGRNALPPPCVGKCGDAQTGPRAGPGPSRMAPERTGVSDAIPVLMPKQPNGTPGKQPLRDIMRMLFRKRGGSVHGRRGPAPPQARSGTARPAPRRGRYCRTCENQNWPPDEDHGRWPDGARRHHGRYSASNRRRAMPAARNSCKAPAESQISRWHLWLP